MSGLDNISLESDDDSIFITQEPAKSSIIATSPAVDKHNEGVFKFDLESFLNTTLDSGNDSEPTEILSVKHCVEGIEENLGEWPILPAYEPFTENISSDE